MKKLYEADSSIVEAQLVESVEEPPLSPCEVHDDILPDVGKEKYIFNTKEMVQESNDYIQEVDSQKSDKDLEKPPQEFEDIYSQVHTVEIDTEEKTTNESNSVAAKPDKPFTEQTIDESHTTEKDNFPITGENSSDKQLENPRTLSAISEFAIGFGESESKPTSNETLLDEPNDENLSPIEAKSCSQHSSEEINEIESTVQLQPHTSEDLSHLPENTDIALASDLSGSKEQVTLENLIAENVPSTNQRDSIESEVIVSLNDTAEDIIVNPEKISEEKQSVPKKSEISVQSNKDSGHSKKPSKKRKWQGVFSEQEEKRNCVEIPKKSKKVVGKTNKLSVVKSAVTSIDTLDEKLSETAGAAIDDRKLKELERKKRESIGSPSIKTLENISKPRKILTIPLAALKTQQKYIKVDRTEKSLTAIIENCQKEMTPNPTISKASSKVDIKAEHSSRFQQNIQSKDIATESLNNAISDQKDQIKLQKQGEKLSKHSMAKSKSKQKNLPSKSEFSDATLEERTIVVKNKKSQSKSPENIDKKIESSSTRKSSLRSKGLKTTQNKTVNEVVSSESKPLRRKSGRSVSSSQLDDTKATSKDDNEKPVEKVKKTSRGRSKSNADLEAAIVEEKETKCLRSRSNSRAVVEEIDKTVKDPKIKSSRKSRSHSHNNKSVTSIKSKSETKETIPETHKQSECLVDHQTSQSEQNFKSNDESFDPDGSKESDNIKISDDLKDTEDHSNFKGEEQVSIADIPGQLQESCLKNIEMLSSPDNSAITENDSPPVDKEEPCSAVTLEKPSQICEKNGENSAISDSFNIIMLEKCSNDSKVDISFVDEEKLSSAVPSEESCFKDENSSKAVLNETEDLVDKCFIDTSSEKEGLDDEESMSNLDGTNEIAEVSSKGAENNLISKDTSVEEIKSSENSNDRDNFNVIGDGGLCTTDTLEQTCSKHFPEFEDEQNRPSGEEEEKPPNPDSSSELIPYSKSEGTLISESSNLILRNTHLEQSDAKKDSYLDKEEICTIDSSENLEASCLKEKMPASPDSSCKL
ncbi:hypothetical protein JTB14_015652 [Gonioctena quinquepunctata]|nr:hypothetical protein JTB14_015652 [Gonioctena quinquepunctata]